MCIEVLAHTFSHAPSACRRCTRSRTSALAYAMAARYIKNGTVTFPRTGCEQLLNQLFGFGSEKHDDLVDALVYPILGVAGESIEQPKVHMSDVVIQARGLLDFIEQSN